MVAAVSKIRPFIFTRGRWSNGGGDCKSSLYKLQVLWLMGSGDRWFQSNTYPITASGQGKTTSMIDMITGIGSTDCWGRQSNTDGAYSIYRLCPTTTSTSRSLDICCHRNGAFVPKQEFSSIAGIAHGKMNVRWTLAQENKYFVDESRTDSRTWQTMGSPFRSSWKSRFSTVLVLFSKSW